MRNAGCKSSWMRLPSLSIRKRIVFFPWRNFLVRIDAYIEVIKQQVIICAIRSVRPAQKVGARCPVQRNHGCGEYQKYGETAEGK